ncbi:MAG TPA: adenylate/guanylate cyclase domain-containing protein, partial [Candidatus Binatia bacterium]|nr:adenylate/guanylate cyclase domain-containing protein [Candidatus Binatia bacterium]
MICSACGHENRPGRKFCVECGAALALACPACSSRCEAGEKFCGECGAALSAGPARQPLAADRSAATPSPPSRSAADAGARKVVTIVFADLVGSTALHERLDAESARRLMERYYESLRAVVADHDGTVVKLLGDGVMAAFGLDRLAEDDALRAVHAAAAMQRAFRALVQNESGALGAAGLRVAVNTGEVVVSGASDDLIGDPVNVAARLQEQGNDGDVVLGETTRRLVATRVTLAPIGSVTLKGRAEAVAAYRLVSLDPPAGVASTPFVGRESELARLEAVCDAAIAAPATRLAVLLGSPGLGKSRLVDEIARRHSEGATILFAHCNAAGGATFAPIAQAVRGLLGLDDSASGEPVRVAVAAALAAAGVEESEHARLVAGIGGLLTGATASPEETFFVVRRFLARLTDAKPVVLVIDDVHWAEPLLLDLIEHLVQWGSGIPLYILVGARPELRGLRSSLATPGALVADVVTLAGLDAGAAMR